MITAVTIENFKGIRGPRRLEFKPITLLFGPNSAGKSSIIHAIDYAREVLVSGNYDAQATALGSNLGGFRNFVHGHDLSRQVTIRIEASFKPGEELYEPTVTSGEVESELEERISALAFRIRDMWIEFSIGWNVEDMFHGPYMSRYSVGLNGLPLGIICAPEPIGRSNCTLVDLNRNHPLFKELNSSEGNATSLLDDVWLHGGGELDELAQHLKLQQSLVLPSTDHPFVFARGYDPLSVRLISMLMVGPLINMQSELRYDLVHLGPLREVPSLRFNLCAPYRGINTHGGLDAWEAVARFPYLLERTNKWLQGKDGLELGYVLKVKRYVEIEHHPESLVAELSGEPTSCEIILVRSFSDIELRPVDLGVGVAQILPVVVAAVGANNKVIAVEQPELHLHPRLQCALGDLFIAGALEDEIEQRTFLLETHSEHLILRILRRIRETTRGKPHNGISVTPNDVAVCYVSQKNGQSVLETIGIDVHGEFTRDWPDDFFESDFYERFS